MNFRDLKYLIAVADLHHFGQAALHCHVSQPTLSAQLKKLEDELDVQIFERNNKQVLTTVQGKRIIAQARVILREMELLRSIAATSKDPLAGLFKVGIIPTLGPYLLPYVVPLVKKHLPKVQLQLHEDKTEYLLKALHQGDVDAVIVALPVAAPNCQVQELFCEPFFVALPHNHRLSKRRQLKVNDLRGEKILLLEVGY